MVHTAPNFLVLRLLRWRTLTWLVGREAPIRIRTWCRVCGEPAEVVLPCHYQLAVQFLSCADDTPMEHHDHWEDCGWAQWLQFEEVMMAAFPDNCNGSWFFDEYHFDTETFPGCPAQLISPGEPGEMFQLDFFDEDMPHLQP